MKTIFRRRFPASVKIIFIVILSFGIIVSAEPLSPVKKYISTLLSPLQFIANAPLELLETISNNIKFRNTLIMENKALKEMELQLSDRLLRVVHLEQENTRLSVLLGSPVNTVTKKLIAKVQVVDSDPFKLQVIVNKGLDDNVFIGQPVIDEHGVVGQVIQVSQYSSRILLIADNSHAIPLRNQRNDVRLIGLGKGDVHQMELQYVTKNTDVKIGDMLVTSGLGNLFPEGYPVAKVTGIENRGSEIYSTIHIQPTAQLDRIRYVLLLWPNKTHSEQLISAPSQ